MKSLLLLGIVFASFFLCACQKELLYSCDPEIDKIVRNNISEVQVMDRTQWLNIEKQDLQRGYYVAFSSEQKHTFWKEKLAEVLELDWSEQERAHLLILVDFLEKNPQMFSPDKNQKADDTFDLFMYRWQDDAKEKLGWNKKMLYAIAATGNKMLNKAGDIASASDSDHPLVKSRSESGSGSGWKNCSCSTKQDFCDLTGEFQQRCREYAGCKLYFIDCGWVRKQECDGNCIQLWA